MAAGRKTGGRKKGTPNKQTTSVADNLIAAFAALGGLDAMVAWARRNRTTFYKIWAKMLPKDIRAELSGPNGTPISHELRVTVTAADVALARTVLGLAGGDVHPDGGPEPVAGAP